MRRLQCSEHVHLEAQGEYCSLTLSTLQFEKGHPQFKSEVWKVALKDFSVYFCTAKHVFNLTLSIGRSSEVDLTSSEAFASESVLQGMDTHAASVLQRKH